MNEKIKAARQMLGRFFKERREDLKLSPQTLANRLGISTETIRGIESGRFAWNIDLHLRICDALGIRHELIRSDEEQPDYVVQQLEDKNGFTCTDTKNMISVSWQDRKFNDTQKVSFLNSTVPDAGQLATAMRQIGDWLVENHSEKL